MQYRLHIDIPLGTDEEEAEKNAELLVMYLFNEERNYFPKNLGVEQVNYRLGYDDDRQKSNYLDKNENGHVSNKKTRISISG
jgi:hypothetical protein